MTPAVDVFSDPINLSALISIVIKIIAIGTVALFILPQQVRDTVDHLKKDDGFQRLRYYILVFLVLYLSFSAPPFIYQAYRLFGLDYGLLSNFASISSNLSLLSITIWLVLVYTYKKP